jgi:hypothetical protein
MHLLHCIYCIPVRIYCRESASVAVDEPFSASVAAVVHLLQQQLHILHLKFMCISVIL